MNVLDSAVGNDFRFLQTFQTVLPREQVSFPLLAFWERGQGVRAFAARRRELDKKICPAAQIVRRALNRFDDVPTDQQNLSPSAVRLLTAEAISVLCRYSDNHIRTLFFAATAWAQSFAISTRVS